MARITTEYRKTIQSPCGRKQHEKPSLQAPYPTQSIRKNTRPNKNLNKTHKNTGTRGMQDTSLSKKSAISNAKDGLLPIDPPHQKIPTPPKRLPIPPASRPVDLMSALCLQYRTVFLVEVTLLLAAALRISLLFGFFKQDSRHARLIQHLFQIDPVGII